jgi:hypothetical protein
MDKKETKPMQASCLPRQAVGASLLDIYTARRRAASFHRSPMRASREEHTKVIYLGCNS